MFPELERNSYVDYEFCQRRLYFRDVTNAIGTILCDGYPNKVWNYLANSSKINRDPYSTKSRAATTSIEGIIITPSVYS